MIYQREKEDPGYFMYMEVKEDTYEFFGNLDKEGERSSGWNNKEEGVPFGRLYTVLVDLPREVVELMHYL